MIERRKAIRFSHDCRKALLLYSKPFCQPAPESRM